MKKLGQCVIIKGNRGLERALGDLVLINMPHTGQRYARLSDRDGNHGVLLWHVFNRRLRVLGYMRDSRTIDISKREDVGSKLCIASEEELSLYVHKLIEAEEIECKEFAQKALITLSDHPLP